MLKEQEDDKPVLMVDDLSKWSDCGSNKGSSFAPDIPMDSID